VNPALQQEFRALLRGGFERARFAAAQTGKTGFSGLDKLPWE
jgi:hypothetical protein